MLEHKVMHHIQRDILRSLLDASHKRFKDIKPAGLESNIFMYHLKALIKEGLVEKVPEGYALTTEGKRFVDRANLESLKVRIQPKSITILAVENSEGQIAVLERLHQPFIGHKGFPSGKIHYGESLQEAASRELKEKTGLTATLQLRGTFVMRFTLDGTVVNHIIGFVFYGKTANQVLDFQKPYFKSYWADKQVLYEDNRFKGHPELFELLKNTPKDTLFFAEHEFTSDF